MLLLYHPRVLSCLNKPHVYTVLLYKMHVLLNMTCSILEDPLDEEAVDLRREVHTRLLYVICPHITNIAHHGLALTSD